MMVFALAVYALIGFFTARHLIRRKYWKDLSVFGVFFALALVMTVLQIKGVQLPNPFDAYNSLLETLGLHY